MRHPWQASSFVLLFLEVSYADRATGRLRGTTVRTPLKQRTQRRSAPRFNKRKEPVFKLIRRIGSGRMTRCAVGLSTAGLKAGRRTALSAPTPRRAVE